MKSFKSFLREQEEKLPAFGTHFGSHAQEKKLPPFGTNFGSHSKEKPTPEPESESQPEKFHADPFISSPIHKESVQPTKGNDQLNLHDQKTADDIHDRNEVKTNTNEIEHYTDWSKDINGSLHEHYKSGKKPNRQTMSHIKKLDKTLSKHKISHDLHVFSGLRESPEKLFKDKKDGESALTHFPAYTSTSTSFHMSSRFSDFQPIKNSNIGPNKKHKPLNTDTQKKGELQTRHMIKLHVPKGTLGGSIRNESVHPGEDEILLHRGLHVEIHPHPTTMFHPDAGPHDGDHVTVWHARVVGHNPKEIS